MAFSEFKTLAEVQNRYQIEYIERKFAVELSVPIAKSFAQRLAFNMEHIDVLASESARCELLIAPMLLEVYKNHYLKYSFWVQKSIFYDDILHGTPDYLFSKRSKLGKTVLETPIVIVVEAKKDDFTQGWGQCLAELVAVQKLNNNVQLTVYGIVTNGVVWQFGHLLTDKFVQNPENFTIDRLSQLYSALESLLEMAGRNLEATGNYLAP